tara:strand:- start:866 stop:1099 length:234 start_codon:yes stop_codon:yes gene_type:complete
LSDSITITSSFVEKDGTWVVSFSEVDFITWKENYDDKSYFVKLHIGSKETRLQLDYEEDVAELVSAWKKYKTRYTGE